MFNRIENFPDHSSTPFAREKLELNLSTTNGLITSKTIPNSIHNSRYTNVYYCLTVSPVLFNFQLSKEDIF